MNWWEEIDLHVQPTFDPGTTLSLFAGSVADSGHPRPLGRELDSQVVDDGGNVTFADLTEGMTYSAGGVIAEAWRFITFAIPTRSVEERVLATKADLSLVDERSSQALEEFGEGVGQGNADRDTVALQTAIAELASSTEPFTRKLLMGDRSYRVNQPLIANHPIVIEGRSSYGSRLLVDDDFPGGPILTFTNVGTPQPLLLEENHLPGWGMRHLMIDGNGRHVDADGIGFHMADRGQFLDIHMRNLKGSSISGSSLRESQFTQFRTWLCGDVEKPNINLWDDGTGGVDGHNLLHFNSCQFMLPCGDHVLIGTDAPGGQIVRAIFFNQVVFHGLLEYYDRLSDNWGHDGDKKVSLPQGAQRCRHVIRNARDIFYDLCRFNLPGRGLPIFSLEQSALGAASINTVSIDPSVLTIRPGATARAGQPADVATDAIELNGVFVEEVGNVIDENQLQTGSRIRLTGKPPAPLALLTDYYVIVSDETHFKVATTRVKAMAGEAVDLTTAGEGFNVVQQDWRFAANAAADTITCAQHRLPSYGRLRLETDNALPGGLEAGVDYYVLRVDANTIKLASSLSKAMAGEAINLTTAGAGNCWFTIVQFFAEVREGFLGIGDPQQLENLPSRAYVLIGPEGTLNWPNAGSSTSRSVPLAELEGEGGVTPFTDIRSHLRLVDNNTALYGFTTAGKPIQIARITAGDVVALGQITGEEGHLVQLVSGTEAEVLINGEKKVDIKAAGVGFNGKAPNMPKLKPPAEATAKEVATALLALGLATE